MVLRNVAVTHGQPYNKRDQRWYVVVKGITIGLVAFQDGGWFAYNRGSTQVNAEPVPSRWAAVKLLINEFWAALAELGPY